MSTPPYPEVLGRVPITGRCIPKSSGDCIFNSFMGNSLFRLNRTTSNSLCGVSGVSPLMIPSGRRSLIILVEGSILLGSMYPPTGISKGASDFS